MSLGSKHKGCHERQISIDEEQQQQSILVRRPRKPRTSTKWPNDKIVVTEIGQDRVPTDRRAQQRLRTLAGLIGRQNPLGYAIIQIPNS